MSSLQIKKIIGASEPGFDDIVDFFPEPCFAINLRGKVIAWNQAMVELTGIEAVDMIGKGDYEYAIPFYGVRRPILIDLAINPDQEIAKKYKYVRKINDTLVSEIENVSMGNKSFYLWNTARKLCNAQGDCIGAIEVVRDLTELKKTEDLGYRYDLLKKQSRDIILFIDPEDGRIIEANDAAVRIYGYSHDELLSMSISDLRTTSNGYLVSNQMTDAVLNGILFETEHRKKNGSAFPVEVSSKGATVGGGFLLISIIRDISLRKKAERALRQLNETLEQRVAKRTELAENRAKQLQALAVELVQVEERERRRVSHILHEDLQQILAAARFQLQAACQGIPPIPMLTCVERLLEESIEKSRRLSHELSPAVLYHYGLFSAMEWLVRQMAEQFGLEVMLEMEEKRRFANATLEVFLFRAIQELLFNVVKHAGVRCANVFISRFNACLVATISDEGRGFKHDMLDSSTVKAGLGLVSLRERTHAMGGEFEIKSAPGKGSRFTLSFPVTLIEDEEPRQRI